MVSQVYCYRWWLVRDFDPFTIQRRRIELREIGDRSAILSGLCDAAQPLQDVGVETRTTIVDQPDHITAFADDRRVERREHRRFVQPQGNAGERGLVHI